MKQRGLNSICVRLLWGLLLLFIPEKRTWGVAVTESVSVREEARHGLTGSLQTLPRSHSYTLVSRGVPRQFSYVMQYSRKEKRKDAILRIPKQARQKSYGIKIMICESFCLFSSYPILCSGTRAKIHLELLPGTWSKSKQDYTSLSLFYPRPELKTA